MQILPISTVKNKFSEYVDAVSVTHEQVTITKNGAPTAVLVGADEWESLQETLFWLSRSGTAEAIIEAEHELATGATSNEDEVRAEFNAPRR